MKESLTIQNLNKYNSILIHFVDLPTIMPHTAERVRKCEKNFNSPHIHRLEMYCIVLLCFESFTSYNGSNYPVNCTPASNEIWRVDKSFLLVDSNLLIKNCYGHAFFQTHSLFLFSSLSHFNLSLI